MVSIIIPCYNSKPSLLKRCIESISKQSYNDIEIVVVDDGSDKAILDSIRNIVEHYANARLIEAQHGGLSYARNIGVKNAIGEYVTFVDSDDTVSEWMIENLLSAIEKNKACIALGYVVGEKEDEDYHFTNSIFDVKVLSHKELEKAAFVGFTTRKSNIGFLTCGPCGALYKKSLVLDNLFSVELEIFEDVYWNVLIFRAAEKVVCINQPIYGYRCVDGSITHTWKLSTIEKRLFALDKIERELISSRETQQWYAVRLLTNYTTIVSCVMKTKELHSKRERIDFAKEISKKPVWELLNKQWIGKSWNLKNKAKLVLYRMNMIIPMYYLKYGRNTDK